MKFTTVFVALAAVATVSAARVDTNAYRMARGLPPNPPAQRSTPALAAKRGTPSGVPPGECKPLLQSCSVNSECCGDVCLLGLCV
ncbi:hypothetical protein B0H14DRAFT_2881035 [Mycena olivaceomarginata]|nr:hypothetical protein B0H14DRAFT_2881035 [Mycena olivaceomarginata]